VVKKTSLNSASSAVSTSNTGAFQDEDTANSKQQNGKRSRLSQTSVPSYSLEDALRIPRAIGDSYAFRPTSPLNVAAALNMRPTSSHFRMLAGAAIAYGLTEGGSNSSLVSVTQLAQRILNSPKSGDDIQPRREAFLTPRIIKEFLTHYDENKLPRDDIAKNVLVSMGVPQEAADRTLNLIIDGARRVGFLKDIKGATYVSLQPTTPVSDSQDIASENEDQEFKSFEFPFEESNNSQDRPIVNLATVPRLENRRVFITHGKNKSFIEPLKDLLVFGNLEPIVSTEQESILRTIPDKIINGMQSCIAAIIHIEDEQKLMDAEGNQHVFLNPNVLIEIGAAMALYGRKFILLVKSDIQLPSSLQGLYEVRYEGNNLNMEAMSRLMKAINDMKNQSLPTESA